MWKKSERDYKINIFIIILKMYFKRMETIRR